MGGLYREVGEILVLVLMFVLLGWMLKRKLSDDLTPREEKQWMRVGLLTALFSCLFPSAARPGESLLTLSRVLLAATAAGMVALLVRIVAARRSGERSPGSGPPAGT